MNTYLLKKANEAFNAGEYKEARIAYQKAAELYGSNLVAANLQICNKRIALTTKNNEKPVLGSLDLNRYQKSDLSEIIREGLGIEQIYIVNLDRRLDRFVRVIREMNINGLTCKRIQGVDAKYSSVAQKLFDDFKSRPFTTKRKSSLHVPDSRFKRFKRIVTIGAFGYLLSQKKVFEDAKKNGYKKILVLDDDVFWHSKATTKIAQISREIGHAYKILLLGSSEYTERESKEFISAIAQGSENLYHPIPDRTCGSFAVAYDQSIYDYILEAIAEADGPFDNVALGSIYIKFKEECFAAIDSICIPNVDDSDIRESERTQVAYSRRMNWETVRFSEFAHDISISVIASSYSSLDSVAKIKKAIFPGVNISIFYLTEDGFRSVIPGHEFKAKEEQIKMPKWSDAELFRSLIEDSGLPSADIYISWPKEKEITGESVIQEISNILERVNRGDPKSGRLKTHVYCADYKRIIKKGRHSIIIPCFRSIEESFATIQSALLQDANDFEMIVVNDNPEVNCFDETLRAKLRDWARTIGKENVLDRLIILEHTKNRGASAARNTGLFHSSGEWISFLDDDDYFEPNRLSAVEEILSLTDDKIGACYCGYTGSWNGTVDMNRFPEGNLREKVITLRYADHYMCTNTISFKREALEKIGGFDEGYNRHQDLELMARFFEEFEIKAVRKFLVRNRPAAVSSTFNPDLMALSRLKVKFLRDLASTLDKKDSTLLDSIISAHVADLFKKYKNVSAETITLARAMLGEALS